MYRNLYRKLLPRTPEQSTRNPRTSEITSGGSGIVTLHLDFVAKPEGTRLLYRELGELLKDAGLMREGLETGLLLVSDREARLVTLLTFWDAQRFRAGRERRIAWMQKLLAPFADGPVRAQTSAPHFVLPELVSEIGNERSLRDCTEEFARVAG